MLNRQVHLKFFSQENIPSSDDILLVFKTYFKLLNIKNTKVFYSKNHLRLEIHKHFSNGEQSIGKFLYLINIYNCKLGSTIQNSITKFDFSSENIFELNRLLGTKLYLINPTSYSNICATTGFIVFIIKDALEYAGLIVTEKKVIPKQLFNYYTYSLEKLNESLFSFNKKFKNI